MALLRKRLCSAPCLSVRQRCPFVGKTDRCAHYTGKTDVPLAQTRQTDVPVTQTRQTDVPLTQTRQTDMPVPQARQMCLSPRQDRKMCPLPRQDRQMRPLPVQDRQADVPIAQPVVEVRAESETGCKGKRCDRLPAPYGSERLRAEFSLASSLRGTTPRPEFCRCHSRLTRDHAVPSRAQKRGACTPSAAHQHPARFPLTTSKKTPAK